MAGNLSYNRTNIHFVIQNDQFMKSIIFLALLTIGIASCETPQPATGTTDETTSPTTGSGTGTTGTTGTSGTDTSTTGSGTDTTTTKRDSLP